MTADPVVTIGLPIRNGENYLREALECLLAQEFGDFEIVVSDNASTDGTPEILREFAAREARLRLYREETNLGASANYNRVLDLARGRYFRWHACDDLVSPDSLARCVAELSAHPEAVIAYPRTRLIDADGAPAGEYDDRLDLRDPKATVRFERVLRLIGECNAVFGLMRTDTLRRTARIGCFPGADIVLLTELSLHGAFHALDGPVFSRRTHPASSSWDRSDAAQLQFYRPGTRRRVFMRAFRHHWEYGCAVLRSPLRPGAKLRALGILTHLAVKWRRAFLADLTRLWRNRRPRIEAS